MHSNSRGRGSWKLDTSFLTDTDYITITKLTIEQTRKEYRNDDSVNSSLLWEMMKVKVREKSISYAIGKKRKVVDKEHFLELRKKFVTWKRISHANGQDNVQKYLNRRIGIMQKRIRGYIEVMQTRGNS